MRKEALYEERRCSSMKCDAARGVDPWIDGPDYNAGAEGMHGLMSRGRCHCGPMLRGGAF